MTSLIPIMPANIRTFVLPSPLQLPQCHGFNHPTTGGKKHRRKPAIKDRYIPSFDKTDNTCGWVLVPFEIGIIFFLISLIISKSIIS
jgi:hypothetical protein